MFENILSSVLWLGGMGLIFGAVLAYAAKKFEVPVDPKIEQIRQVLPGANCGGCGYAGCDDLARAIGANEVKASACSSLSAEKLAQIAQITGLDTGEVCRKKAHIKCAGIGEASKRKFKYHGIESCREAMIVMQGDKVCEFGCMGYGTCAKVCPNNAIITDPDTGHMKVDESKCGGCGLCVKACPKNIIELVDANQNIRLCCKSSKKGKEAREVCTASCIGCGICEKQCQYGAITIENNLPVIDFKKCSGCGVCIEKCPTKAIKKF